VIETVLIADTLTLGRTLADALGLTRDTTLIVSKADHLRGQHLTLDVRVIDRADWMTVQAKRAIEENLIHCGAIPGTATVVWHDDGTRTIDHADRVISVAVSLLQHDGLAPDVIEPDGILRLDTAGEYRYRFVRAQDEHTHIYERITA
jgi:hypothetical protein